MASRILLLLILLAASTAVPADPPGDLAEGRRFFDIRNGVPLSVGPINRETVTGFELLYATPGTGDLAEIAGHLLLRIKRKQDPALPADADQDDLVLSFLADTGDVPPSPRLSLPPDCRRGNWLNLVLAPGGTDTAPLRSLWQSIRGLSGGFKVATDLQTLAYTIKSYTVDQDRDLLRFELTLTDTQRDQLMDHLIRLRDQPPPSYYFFHQNCGSVLVRVIGQGVGDEATRDFAPWISPPHSLVALMLRRGLARAVEPPLSGFRNRGHLYRGRFQQEYAELMARSPELSWPPFAHFVDRHENRRAEAVRALAALVSTAPQLAPDLYALASLVQEMEMAFDPKDRVCRDYTSRATSEARLLQQEILAFAGPPTGTVLDRDVPRPSPRAGSAHTGLYAFTPGLGLRSISGEGAKGFGELSGALLAQDMGSHSQVAMQQAGFLKLGSYGLSVGADGISGFRVTGLQLRKFRENLGQVPSVVEHPNGWGLGLGFLDFERRSIGPTRTAGLAGIAVLANLVSSPGHHSYAFVGAGVDAGYLHDSGQTDWGPAFPLQAEGVIHAGSVPWRNRLVWMYRGAQGGGEEWHASSRLEAPLGEWRGTEFSLRLLAEWREAGGEAERRISLGLSVLRF